MKRTQIQFFFAIAWIASVSVGYSGTTYNSRAAFEAALSGETIEEFENADLVGETSSGAVASLSFDDFSVATVPNAAKIRGVTTFGAVNSTPAGTRFLYLDTDVGFVGMAATFTFSQPLSAFGFDYSGTFQTGNATLVTIDGQVIGIPGSISLEPKFFGYIDDPDQTFTLPAISTTVQSALGVDRVTYLTVVPEPATFILAFIGLVVLLASARRGTLRASRHRRFQG